MSNKLKKSTATRLGAAILLCASMALTACSMADPDLDNDYRSSAHYDRYPIRVKEAPVKLAVTAKSGMLRPDQINAVANFAQDARHNADSRITIKWPSGSRKSRQVASDIAQLMVDQGVPRAMIIPASYPGGVSSPVRISYLRKVAVTTECGDWSENLAADQSNGPYPNFGCSTQHNIAAMVANPEDFERPRAMSPVTAADRTAVMTIYYMPKADVSDISNH